MGNLSEAFKNLAGRFRRIQSDNPEAGARLLNMAKARGGELIREAVKAGYLEFDYPWPKLTGNDELDEFALSNVWTVYCLSLPLRKPNSRKPLKLNSPKQTGPNVVITRGSKKSDWQGEAENFAEVADYLAEMIGDEKQQQPGPVYECYVTLLQMAAICNKTKKTLERWKREGKLPEPSVKGGKGKADEWLWIEVRPALEKLSSRQFPEVFPADRFAGK